jgi:hypothetical protein
MTLCMMHEREKKGQTNGSVEGTLKFLCYWLINFYQFVRRKICCSEW